MDWSVWAQILMWLRSALRLTKSLTNVTSSSGEVIYKQVCLLAEQIYEQVCLLAEQIYEQVCLLAEQ